MSLTPEHREPEGVAAPPELVRDLQTLAQPPPAVPPSVDEAVLRQVRAHLAALSKPPALASRANFGEWLGVVRASLRGLFEQPSAGLARWAAMAAAVALALGIAYIASRPAAKSSPTAWAAEDINHDGRVDILDALALARQIEAGPATAAQLDLNHDGAVNRQDVELVAACAVRLEENNRLWTCAPSPRPAPFKGGEKGGESPGILAQKL
jgi:hypothetical protein